MSKTLSVILLEKVPNVGLAGDIVEVAEGFARNALFPTGRAALATVPVRTARDRAAAEEKKRQVAATAELQKQADQLDGTELTLLARVKEGEEIFGRITSGMIARELAEQAGLTLKPSQVKLAQPLTRLGSYAVTISLARDVETVIKVFVAAEPHG